MRKVSAVFLAMFVMALTIGALAAPAFGQAYPPTPTAPASAPQQQSVNLAFTGSDSKPLLFLGLIAITVGIVALVAVRRRNSVQASKIAG